MKTIIDEVLKIKNKDMIAREDAESGLNGYYNTNLPERDFIDAYPDYIHCFLKENDIDDLLKKYFSKGKVKISVKMGKIVIEAIK